MSTKEHCISIIEKIPEEQLPYIAAFLENAYKMIDEMLDNAFCIALAERHEKNNPVFKEDDYAPIEEVAKRLGVNLNEN